MTGWDQNSGHRPCSPLFWKRHALCTCSDWQKWVGGKYQANITKKMNWFMFLLCFYFLSTYISFYPYSNLTDHVLIQINASFRLNMTFSLNKCIIVNLIYSDTKYWFTLKMNSSLINEILLTVLSHWDVEKHTRSSPSHWAQEMGRYLGNRSSRL